MSQLLLVLFFNLSRLTFAQPLACGPLLASPMDYISWNPKIGTAFDAKDFKKSNLAGMTVYTHREYSDVKILFYLSEEGELDLLIKVRGDKSHSSNLKNSEGAYLARYRGEDLLNFVINEIYQQGKIIRRLRGSWNQGRRMSDNFIQFREGQRQGLSWQEAAFNTWTGRQAHRLGFQRVALNSLTKTYVEVVFY